MTMPFRLSAATVLGLILTMGNVAAETTTATNTDRYGKELKIEPSRNIFARFGVLGLKLNNKSEAARDVSGPVLSRPSNLTSPTPGDRGWYCPADGNAIYADACKSFADNGNGIDSIYRDTSPNGILNVLFGGTGVQELGLPDDVRAAFSDPAPGAVGTVGMYFDEDHKWAIEVPVMALPFNIDVYGAGTFQNAGKIITAKSLGFLMFGHYYFGQKNDKFRPSVSLTANYLIPFDVHATSALETWTGGRTKVSSKASLGLGWMIGGKYAFNERWDFNLNFGQFKAKIESTLVTYDTDLRSSNPIFTYWPGQLGENLRDLRRQNLLTGQLLGMRAYRNFDPANRVNGGSNLGTFTRKQTQTLDPYVLLMTVGYNF